MQHKIFSISLYTKDLWFKTATIFYTNRQRVTKYMYLFLKKNKNRSVGIILVIFRKPKRQYKPETTEVSTQATATSPFFSQLGTNMYRIRRNKLRLSPMNPIVTSACVAAAQSKQFKNVILSMKHKLCYINDNWWFRMDMFQQIYKIHTLKRTTCPDLGPLLLKNIVKRANRQWRFFLFS